MFFLPPIATLAFSISQMVLCLFQPQIQLALSNIPLHFPFLGTQADPPKFLSPPTFGLGALGAVYLCSVRWLNEFPPNV